MDKRFDILDAPEDVRALVGECELTGNRTTFLRNGRPIAILISHDEYLALRETMDWLIPTRWGNWYAKGGFQYYHIINDSLLLAQTIVGTASSYATAHREVWVGYAGLGFTF